MGKREVTATLDVQAAFKNEHSVSLHFRNEKSIETTYPPSILTS